VRQFGYLPELYEDAVLGRYKILLCKTSTISGFLRGVKEICVRLGFYAACIGSSSPTFRDNLSVPSLKGAAVQVSLLSPQIPHRLPSKSNPDFRSQKTVTECLSCGSMAVAINMNIFYCRLRAYLNISDFLYAAGKVVEINPIRWYM